MFLSVIIISFLTTSISCVSVCESGFKISLEPRTRQQALQQCMLNGSNLGSIENRAQSDLLLYFLQQIGKEERYYWMSGMSYWKEDESKWWWDSRGKNMNFTEWCTHLNQPQEAEGTNSYWEPCIALHYKDNTICWHDYPCTHSFPYICSTNCHISYPPVHYGEFCIVNEPKTQSEAHAECAKNSRELTLINVDTNSKHNRLLTYLKFYNKHLNRYWTSLKRKTRGSPKWILNSGYGPQARWIYWAPGQPEDGPNDCTIIEFISNRYMFVVVPCEAKYDYICE